MCSPIRTVTWLRAVLGRFSNAKPCASCFHTAFTIAQKHTHIAMRNCCRKLRTESKYGYTLIFYFINQWNHKRQCQPMLGTLDLIFQSHNIDHVRLTNHLVMQFNFVGFVRSTQVRFSPMLTDGRKGKITQVIRETFQIVFLLAFGVLRISMQWYNFRVHSYSHACTVRSFILQTSPAEKTRFVLSHNWRFMMDL